MSIRGLIKNIRGVAALEFAFMAPILLFMLLGVVEISRNVQFNQKIDSASNQMVNIINQNLNLSLSSANAIMNSVNEMLKPYNGGKVAVFITAIQQDSPTGQSDVKWQVKKLPVEPAYANMQSKIAPSGTGSKVTLDFIQLTHREQIIAVELFVEYKPIVNSSYTRKLLGLNPDDEFQYRYSIGRPRFGSFQIVPH